MQLLTYRALALTCLLSALLTGRTAADDKDAAFGKRSLAEWEKQLKEGNAEERATATVLGEIGRGGRSSNTDPPHSGYLDKLYLSHVELIKLQLASLERGFTVEGLLLGLERSYTVEEVLTQLHKRAQAGFFLRFAIA